MNLEPPVPQAARWKVLLVDDEPAVHEVSRLILADLVFEGTVDVVSRVGGQSQVTISVSRLDKGPRLTSVTLLTPAYFRQELADGRLFQPFDRVIDEGQSYWLAFPEGRRNVPKIRVFRDWIVAEAAKAG